MKIDQMCANTFFLTKCFTDIRDNTHISTSEHQYFSLETLQIYIIYGISLMVYIDKKAAMLIKLTYY